MGKRKKAPAEIAEERILSARKSQGHTLDLNGLELTSLPESLWQLTALRWLDLSNNQLRSVPESLGQLTALKLLDLSRNQLRSVPESLWQLTALEWLSLSRNQLRSVPESLGQLTALRWLYLSDNQLTSVPELLGQLTELHLLSLDRNQLTSMPESLRRLRQLAVLQLHGNPALGLPDEVLERSKPAEILDYYFRIQGVAGRELGECKLIVVGRGGAGKTSLIRRLSGQLYNPDEPETHGITIQKLEFSGEKGRVTGRVWDFGGQVVLHSMHEFFLTARSLYLLVLGERDDMLERDAAYWLQLIRSYAGDAPVVVALNKSAGRQRQFDRATLEKSYGPILDWVPTECSEADLTTGGITKLRKTLTTALDSDHMESVRRKFPRKWFAIKEALEEMQESYLDYHAYVKRCRDLGESGEKEQNALAADLHDLGVALNYGRDPRLRDTTVLRPDWLANGIYAVLRANDLDDKRLPPVLNMALAPDGVVTSQSMERIHAKAEAWGMLRAADYPEEKRVFLLRLMDTFHLSYPMDDEDRQHLVPSLLPLHPPERTDEPEGPDRVRLRYEFQVVPAPLLPWFIARTFSLIPDRLHWRRGAILTFGDARARVWTTQDERYVFVTVAGPERDRTRLLSIIRGTLEELFRDYKGLQPVEQWEHNERWVPKETLEEFGVLRRRTAALDAGPDFSVEKGA